MSKINQAGFYYGLHGKKLHTEGFIDKAAIEAQVAALDPSTPVVVDWNSHSFDKEGHVSWETETLAPEEDTDGTGSAGEGTPEPGEDEATR